MTASVEETTRPPVVEEPTRRPDPSPAAVNDAIETVVRATSLEFASFDELMRKPRRTKTVKATVPGPEGKPVQRQLLLEALSPEEFDTLVAAYPPNGADKEKGFTWNPDTFQPALVAACCVKPDLTLAQANALWANEAWAAGERSSLFFAALDVCGGSLDVPFTDGA